MSHIFWKYRACFYNVILKNKNNGMCFLCCWTSFVVSLGKLLNFSILDFKEVKNVTWLWRPAHFEILSAVSMGFKIWCLALWDWGSPVSFTPGLVPPSPASVVFLHFRQTLSCRARGKQWVWMTRVSGNIHLYLCWDGAWHLYIDG